MSTVIKAFSNIFFQFSQPNRIYYLEDTTGEALDWCQAIDKARDKYIRTS